MLDSWVTDGVATAVLLSGMLGSIELVEDRSTNVDSETFGFVDGTAIVKVTVLLGNVANVIVGIPDELLPVSNVGRMITVSCVSLDEADVSCVVAVAKVIEGSVSDVR